MAEKKPKKVVATPVTDEDEDSPGMPDLEALKNFLTKNLGGSGRRTVPTKKAQKKSVDDNYIISFKLGKHVLVLGTNEFIIAGFPTLKDAAGIFELGLDPKDGSKRTAEMNEIFRMVLNADSRIHKVNELESIVPSIIPNMTKIVSVAVKSGTTIMTIFVCNQGPEVEKWHSSGDNFLAACFAPEDFKPLQMVVDHEISDGIYSEIMENLNESFKSTDLAHEIAIGLKKSEHVPEGVTIH